MACNAVCQLRTVAVVEAVVVVVSLGVKHVTADTSREMHRMIFMVNTTKNRIQYNSIQQKTMQ